jgi:hypothetical protein
VNTLPREPAPADLEHPTWCDLARCTAHQEPTIDDRRTGRHWSAPWRVQAPNPLALAYPVVELALWLHTSEPVDDRPAVEVTVSRRDCTSIEGYELHVGQLRRLADVLVEVAGVGFDAPLHLDQGDLVWVGPEQAFHRLAGVYQKLDELHDWLDGQLVDEQADGRVIAEKVRVRLADVLHLREEEDANRQG